MIHVTDVLRIDNTRIPSKEVIHINIRKADIQDIHTLMELRKQQLQDEGQKPDTDMDESLYQYFYKEMSKGKLVEYVAEDAGKVIACAAVIFTEFPPSFVNSAGLTGYVANVYTANEYRGKGIAGELLCQIEAEAKAKGITRLLLHASKMGIRAYEKAGFQETDTVMEKDI